ncbi:MAG TPA: acyl carrier protein [Chthoniobacterales bacterium]
MTVDQRLRKVFADVFELSPEKITDEASPTSIERWDSMNAMVLATALEYEFNVQFTDQELMKMTSYGVIRKTLEAKAG